MQDMIQRIVDADNEARALEEANRKEADEQKKKISEDAKKIYDKYMNEAMSVIEKNNAYEEQKAEQQWKEIESRQKSALIKLKADYQNNRDRWVDEIVKRVIG